jgi:predicted DNA-binding transcriptional regulator AlpA
MNPKNLHDSAWLAKRLDVSLTTIERLRARGDGQLPPHITIGHSIRYDEVVIEAWLAERLSKENQYQPPPPPAGEST